jgi:serine/threonine-protein kinase
VDRIAKYEIERQLGAGYFGVTYLALDPVTLRKVALKVFKPHAWLSIEHLRSEVRPLVMLEHENVVRYVEWNVFTGKSGKTGYYVATEYAADGTLRDHIPELDVRTAVRYCKQILSGLGACHRMGILHRDLKPENIFVSDGRCKIGDFGIAKIQDAEWFSGDVAGTPHYMAPEQFPPSEITRGAPTYGRSA